jgi:hypothetical protein
MGWVNSRVKKDKNPARLILFNQRILNDERLTLQ